MKKEALYIIVAFAALFILFSTSSALAFCQVQGYVFNASGSIVNSTSYPAGTFVVASCANNTAFTPIQGSSSSNSVTGTYAIVLGGIFDDCTKCNSIYTTATNASTGIWGDYNNTSPSGDTSAQNITLSHIPDISAPVYSNLNEPSDPSVYGSEPYQFNSTWDDGDVIDTVVLTFDGVNYSSSSGGVLKIAGITGNAIALSTGNGLLSKLYYTLKNFFSGIFGITGKAIISEDGILSDSGVYSKTFSNLEIGVYNYTWWANDSSGNANQTNLLNFSVVSMCGAIIINNITLEGNLECTGTALNIGADNLTIDCAGFSIIGNGTGNGIYDRNLTGPGYTLLVKNCNFANFSTDINALGGDFEDNGFKGGAVTVESSTLSSINSDGGNGWSSGGSGGTVNIINSTVTVVSSLGAVNMGVGSGGNVYASRGSIVNTINNYGLEGMGWGYAGSTTITGSNVTTINTYGSTGGGSGGTVMISSNSHVLAVNAFSGDGAYGNQGGFVNVTDSFVENLNNSGIGTGSTSGECTAPNGGNTVISNSTVNYVNSYGGSTSDCSNGGNGGNVTITNSNLITVNSNGGFGITSGGKGGIVNLIDSNLNLSSISIDISGGTGSSTNGAVGTLKLNNSEFSADYGEIKFFYIQTSNTTFNSILNISNNLISLDSNTYPSWNVSANLTIFNTNGLGLANRHPYRNGDVCSELICTELSDADSYVFNVTGFTNYSVGEKPDIDAPVITIVNPAQSSTLSYGTTSTRVNISTDENAICRYNLTSSAFSFSEGINFTNTGTSSHSFDLNVSNGQTYTLYYKCNDSLGNINPTSTTHTFSVSATAPPSGGGGGGGGGGGTSEEVVNETVPAPVEIVPIENKTIESVCGDNICDKNEKDCCTDCGCKEKEECIDNICVKLEEKPLIERPSLPAYASGILFGSLESILAIAALTGLIVWFVVFKILNVKLIKPKLKARKVSKKQIKNLKQKPAKIVYNIKPKKK